MPHAKGCASRIHAGAQAHDSGCSAELPAR